MPGNQHKIKLQTASSLNLEFLKELIAEGEIKEALKLLRQMDIRDDSAIAIRSAQFKRLERERERGTISRPEYNLELNQITHAFLSVIDNIPREQQLWGSLKVLNESANIVSSNPIDLSVPTKSDLEKIFGKEELQDINWLQKALNASKSVCKVTLPNNESGSGFLLPGGYLLTNHHVLDSKETAGKAKIIFNYLTNKDGDALPQSEYKLDSATYLTSPEAELDYAFVKVIDNPENPLSTWGEVRLEESREPQVGEKANIIQHPGGERMKIALPDEIIGSFGQHLFYLADTKEGSSGSPVFNQKWKVIALHHAGKTEKDGDGKKYQINAAGDKAYANKGILMKRIIEDLKSKGIDLLA